MGLREVYQEKVDTQLLQWLVWIEQFKAEPVLPLRGRQTDALRALQRLTDCYRMARDKLDALKVSREQDWEIAKAAVERAMIELKLALEQSGADRAESYLRLKTHKNYVYEPFERKE